MEEKKYLKWYNKVGYGSGDLAANCIYGLVTSFVMIYLTDTVGLNSAVIGVLIAFARVFDGISDVIFGNLMDKTHTKMGKARPWMLWTQVGNCICLVLLFSVPMGASDTFQYAYFFIVYVLLNVIFYTANNIAYASLTSLITKNTNERVQMGSIRFMFSLGTNVVVSSVTVGLTQTLGGGAAGWRNVAIIYAIIALIVNTISVFSVKELSEEELSAGTTASMDESVPFVESIKLLFKNKYFIMIAIFYVLMYIQTGIASVGVYWCTYVYGDASALGLFTGAQMVPMIVGLAVTPFLVQKFKGMWKLNFLGYCAATVFRVLFVIAGLTLNVPFMLATAALAGLCTSPVTGDINALISSASEYTVRTQGKHIEGSMFSCSSFGIKVGNGLGTALCGILLDLGGYVANAPVQPDSAVNMLNFMYLWFPLIAVALTTIVMYFLKVEKANADWDKAHGVAK